MSSTNTTRVDRRAPRRIVLGTDNAGDALLWLCDSKRRPRITLQVDGNDVPRLQILDADGNIVAQIPPASGSGAAPPAPSSSLTTRSRSMAGFLTLITFRL